MTIFNVSSPDVYGKVSTNKRKEYQFNRISRYANSYSCFVCCRIHYSLQYNWNCLRQISEVSSDVYVMHLNGCTSIKCDALSACIGVSFIRTYRLLHFENLKPTIFILTYLQGDNV